MKEISHNVFRSTNRRAHSLRISVTVFPNLFLSETPSRDGVTFVAFQITIFISAITLIQLVLVSPKLIQGVSSFWGLPLAQTTSCRKLFMTASPKSKKPSQSCPPSKTPKSNYHFLGCAFLCPKSRTPSALANPPPYLRLTIGSMKSSFPHLRTFSPPLSHLSPGVKLHCQFPWVAWGYV